MGARDAAQVLYEAKDLPSVISLIRSDPVANAAVYLAKSIATESDKDANRSAKRLLAVHATIMDLSGDEDKRALRKKTLSDKDFNVEVAHILVTTLMRMKVIHDVKDIRVYRKQADVVAKVLKGANLNPKKHQQCGCCKGHRGVRCNFW